MKWQRQQARRSRALKCTFLRQWYVMFLITMTAGGPAFAILVPTDSRDATFCCSALCNVPIFMFNGSLL